MNPVLRDCAEGRISPYIALAHFLFEGRSAGEIAAALDEAGPHARLQEMRALLAGREAELDTLARRVPESLVDHHAHGATAEEGIARIAGFFDRAVGFSPEASVALYSLGDPDLLAKATEEVVAYLRQRALVGSRCDVVDLGCGIGRVAIALGELVRSVVGLDVSAGMVAEARRRASGRANLRFLVSTGQDMAMLADDSADLIVAVDSFPYILQTGPAVVARHFQEAKRVLRPGGALALFNISYEPGDEDASLARLFASAHDLALEAAGETPFTIWDGTASVFRKVA